MNTKQILESMSTEELTALHKKARRSLVTGDYLGREGNYSKSERIAMDTMFELQHRNTNNTVVDDE